MAEQQDDKRNQQVGLTNLGMALRVIGALREAVDAVWQALVLNRELKNTIQEGIRLQELGGVLSTIGNPALSRVALRRSQGMFAKQHQSQLQGVATAHLAERALWLKDFAKASALADRAWELAGIQRVERDFIRAALLQGLSALGLGDLERADERLHLALTRARTVNVVEFELPALIAIAKLKIQQENLASAQARLDEVWDATERGPYPLY